jgi:hypothetical protein
MFFDDTQPSAPLVWWMFCDNCGHIQPFQQPFGLLVSPFALPALHIFSRNISGMISI